MDWLYELRPIRFFSFYLAVLFAGSTLLRLSQYQAILSLVVGLKNRWPSLARLVLAHRHIFLTWQVLRPLVILFALMTVNLFASTYVWPQAQEMRVADLLDTWPVLPFVVAAAGAMVAFDLWGLFQVGTIDRAETEKYFDTAEQWLRGWRAPVVSVLSLGYVNPRQIVAREVRAALEGATGWLASTIWWVTTQASLRVACGLALWGSYALQGWLRWLLGVDAA